MYIYEANKKKYIDTILNVAAIIPIIIYINKVFHYALNIPREDDYDVILSHLGVYKSLSFFDKICMLFSQELEHRFFLLKLAEFTHLALFGNINFRHLIIFCLFITIIIFIVLVYFIKKALPQSWKFASLILSLSIFDLNNFENADFVCAGLFHYGVIVLFVLSMLFYDFKKPISILPAIICQILCTFSGGNGFIASFFIVMFTLLNKEYIKSIYSIATFMMFSSLYFFHYTFSHSNSSLVTLDVSRNVNILLKTLGGNFSYEFGFIFGTAVVILFLLLLPIDRNLRFKSKESIGLLCIGGFSLGSLVVMGVCRGKLDINIVAYSSRYLIYSHMLIVVLFVLIFLKYKSEKLYCASAAIIILFYLLNYRGGVEGFEAFYNTEKTMDYAYPIQAKQHAKDVADEVCRQGVYCIEQHRKD